MTRFHVAFRVRGEKQINIEPVRARDAREALTNFVRKHEDDADPVVLVGIEDVKE